MNFLIYLLHLVAFLYFVAAQQQTNINNYNNNLTTINNPPNVNHYYGNHYNGGYNKQNNNTVGSFYQNNGTITNSGSNSGNLNGLFSSRSVSTYSLGAFAKVNWFTAQRICKYNGLTLATITSATEAKAIRNLIRDSETVSSSELFWIGATKYPDNGDYWSWFGSGNPATYTNWAPGQPNSRSDYCLQVGSSGWDDKNCNIQAYFICQPSNC